MESYKERWGPMEMSITWEVDADADVSWLGSYTNQAPESGLYVDREAGAVLGSGERVQHVFGFSPKHHFYLDHEQETAAALEDIGYWLSFTLDEEIDEESRLWAIVAVARKILVGGLTTMGRYEYRYFVPGNDILADEPDFQRRDPTGYQAILDEYGAWESYAAACAAQDYERTLAFGHNWEMMGCIARVSIAGVTLGYDSVWGIESDCGDDYAQEIEADVIGEAKKMAAKALADLIRRAKETRRR